MTQIETAPTVRNGVNVDTMFATLDAIKATPAIAHSSGGRRTSGWAARTTAPPSELLRRPPGDTSRTSALHRRCGRAGHPSRPRRRPEPAEFLLHALAACLTTSVVYIASARGVHLTEVSSVVEGEMDVQGALGLNNEVRNGFQNIRVTFTVKGDAPAEKLQEVVARAQARSAVFDSITRGVPVTVQLAQ